MADHRIRLIHNKQAGIDGATAHTLRHTHSSRLTHNNLNLYEIKDVLGHIDIKTTMRYAHLEQAAVSLKVKEVMNKLNSAASQHGTDTTSASICTHLSGKSA